MSTAPDFQPNVIDDEPSLLTKYAWPLAAVVGVAVLVVVFWTVRDLSRAADGEKAAESYYAAPDDAARFKVLQSHAGAPSLTSEVLALAASQMDSKDYAGAATTYSFFLEHYGSSGFIRSARLGLASARAAQGQTEEALAGFLALAREPYPNLYAGVASIKAARLLLAKKDYATAKSLLEPLSAGSNSAANDARELLKKIPAS